MPTLRMKADVDEALAEDLSADAGKLHRNEWPSMMAATQNGDGVVYRQLLTEVAPLIHSIARNQDPGCGTADDFTRDVLATIHRIRHTFDPGRPFLPWLLGIVNHRLRNPGSQDIGGRSVAVRAF